MAIDKINKNNRKLRSRRPRNKNKQQDQRLSKLENMLKKTVETKIKDYYSTAPLTAATNFHNSGFFTGDVGAEGDERIGRQVNMLSQSFTYNFRIPDGSSSPQATIRLVAVEALDGNEELQATDVLEFAGVSDRLSIVSPYKSNKVVANKGYKVLYDKVLDLNKNSSQSATGHINVQYGSKLSRGKIVDFSGFPLSTTAMNHRLNVFAIADMDGSGQVDMTYACRTRYQDM